MTAAPNLFTRSDTLFGVCEGIGQELRINPIWLRVAFALPLIFAPALVLTAYLSLGATLMLVRWLLPSRRRSADVVVLPVREPAARHADLPLAA